MLFKARPISIVAGNNLLALMQEHVLEIEERRKSMPKYDDIKDDPDALAKADGKTLVVYDPLHRDADSKGILYLPVLLATRRDKNFRVVIDNKLDSYYVITDKCATFEGFLRKVDLALAATPGTEFRGWKRTKQYRYTQEEIDQKIKGKIFIGRDNY